MGLFSRRSTPPRQSSENSAPVVLPAARQVSSQEEADQVFEEVGAIQRAVMDGGSLQGVGEALASRIEGTVLYYLGAGGEPEVVFDRLIVPISEWGLSRLLTLYAMEPGTDKGVAAKHAFDVIDALRQKYQHLNPENT